MKSRLLNLLRLVITVALLAVLLTRIGVEQTYEVLLGGSATQLLLAFGVYLSAVGIRAWRWRMFLKAQRCHVPLRKLVYLYLVGAFFSMFLPTGVGGDVIRMMELSRDGVEGPLSASTVLADRVSGLLALFVIALLSLPFAYRLVTPQVTIAVVVLNLAAFGGLFLLMQRSMVDALAKRLRPLGWLLERKQIQTFYASLASYRGGLLLSSALASLLVNALVILTNVILASALGIDVHVGYFLLFVPLISFLLVLPVSLSGLGIREGGYVYLFAQAGVAPPAALSLSLSFYALCVGTGLIGGIVYALANLTGLRPKDSLKG
jgi:uncharacterized protein (TIRG00374 family)